MKNEAKKPIERKQLEKKPKSPRRQSAWYRSIWNCFNLAWIDKLWTVTFCISHLMSLTASQDDFRFAGGISIASSVNPLALAIIVPYRIIWSWYTGRWWVGCYILYSDEGTGRGRSPPRPIFAIPNVTAHPSTASLQITVLQYNGPLLCGFNVPIKGLSNKK